MEKDHYILLIYKRLKGIISPEEDQDLRKWEATKEENLQITKDLKRAWKESESYELPFELDTDSDFAKIQQRIGKQNTAAKTVSLRKTRRNWLSIAAAVAVLVASVFVLRNVLAEEEVQWISLSADTEIIQITLSDKSQVWLNVGSRISYPETFDNKHRPIRLEGEAFFEVSKDPQRPFEIETAQTKTTVLGTAFNVRAISGETQTEVSVREGKVRVEAPEARASVLLTEKQRVVYDHETATLDKVEDENLNALSWQRKSVQFKNNALSEVIKALSRQFDVEVRLEKNTMNNCPISGRYSTKTDVLNLLKNITAVHEMKIETLAKNEYMLSGGSCN